MRPRRVPHRSFAWFAAWALAFAALAPALSAWFGQGGAVVAIEVCTREGAKVVPADGAAVDGPAHGTSPLEALFGHCPSCTLQQAAAALPPAVATIALLPLSFGLPRRFFGAPRTAFAWRSSRPRGPPRTG